MLSEYLVSYRLQKLYIIMSNGTKQTIEHNTMDILTNTIKLSVDMYVYNNFLDLFCMLGRNPNRSFTVGFSSHSLDFKK